MSSHLLGEIQQMADVIGIISAGRLVREGPIEELLGAEGTVRVRVAPGEVEQALLVLAGFAGPDGATSSSAEPGWISVRTGSDRIGEVNRTLAGAGIWAIGLEAGNDLEMLFLELTGGGPTGGGEGTMGIAGAQAGGPSTDRSTAA